MRFHFSLLLILLFSIDLIAQQEVKKSTESLLPEINPRDIEIRGAFRASFPGVRRQPILGFKPKPRVYQVDPNRLPFMEDENEALIQYPIVPFIQSQTKPALAERLKPTSNGFVRLGAANFQTLDSEAAGHWKSGPTQIDFNGRFFDTGGHLENPQNAAFQERALNISAGHRFNDHQRFFLYSDYEGADLFQSTGTNASIRDMKRFDIIRVKSGYESYRNPVHKNRIHLGLTQNRMRLTDTRIGGVLNEQLIEGQLRLLRPAGERERKWEIILGGELASYNESDIQSNDLTSRISDWHKYYGTVSWKYRLNDQSTLHLEGGIAQFSDYRTDNGIAPLFNFVALSEFGPAFTFKLQLQTELMSHSLEQAQQQNPFIELSPLLPMSQRSRALMQINIQPVSSASLFFRFSYNAWRQFTYFERAPLSLSPNSLFEQRVLSRVQVPQAEVEYQQFALNQRLRWLSGFLIRQPEDENGFIPAHIPQMEIRSSISYRLNEKWDSSISFLRIGERYFTLTDKNASEATKAANELPSYQLFSASVHYKLNPSWQVGIQALNVLNENYTHWQDFTERGREIMFEVRYIF